MLKLMSTAILSLGIMLSPTWHCTSMRLNLWVNLPIDALVCLAAVAAVGAGIEGPPGPVCCRIFNSAIPWLTASGNFATVSPYLRRQKQRHNDAHRNEHSARPRHSRAVIAQEGRQPAFHRLECPPVRVAVTHFTTTLSSVLVSGTSGVLRTHCTPDG